MPVDPGLGERLASRVAAIVADAEVDLLRLLPALLLEGIDGDDWPTRALERVTFLRRQIETGVRGLDQQVVEEIRKAVFDAYNLGSASALIDLDDADIEPRVTPDPIAAAARIAATPTSNVRAAVQQLPDLLTRSYRQAVDAGVREVLGGQVTRRAAAQHVLDRLASDGVTGYRDAAGRNWSLTSYAEMATRTGAGQAAVQGHVDSLSAAGLDLVVVSDAPRECPLCRPYEGKVLSLSGQVGDVVTQSATSQESARVRVFATLDDARSRGLQHPNCRHSISAYLPGASRPKRSSDPAGYEAGQRQREMERKVRQWKRRQAVALDDDAAKAAAGKVRQWQGALREHVDANDLKRLRGREQIGTAT